MGNGKEFSEAMSENGKIQLSSQNGYISPSPMWLAKAFQEQTVVFHCVSVCVDWPFFALPPAITGDHPPETLKVYHRVRKCKF